MDKVLISREELARMIGCGWQALLRMEKRGDIPPRVQLTVNRVLYRRSDIDRWFANNLRPWREIVAEDAQAAEPEQPQTEAQSG